MSYSRNATAKKEDVKPSNDNNGAAKRDYVLADALKAIFEVNGKGPSALPALAIALAGDDLKFPIGEQIARIADSLESIAESFEVIAESMEGGDA